MTVLMGQCRGPDWKESTVLVFTVVLSSSNCIFVKSTFSRIEFPSEKLLRGTRNLGNLINAITHSTRLIKLKRKCNKHLHQAQFCQRKTERCCRIESKIPSLDLLKLISI